MHISSHLSQGEKWMLDHTDLRFNGVWRTLQGSHGPSQAAVSTDRSKLVTLPAAHNLQMKRLQL